MPQLAQRRASGDAHSSQNFALALFSCWQRGHCMGPLLDNLVGPRQE